MLRSMSREALKKVREIALRRGLWFKFLSKFERAAIDLTIRVVEEVKSMQLMLVLARIVTKIGLALKRMSLRVKAMEVGRPLAQRIAEIAVRLGNKEAWKWAQDPSFIMYLGISWLNTSPIFRYPTS